MSQQVTTDVTEATFLRDVVDASAAHPVVVDFWAAWCGPCRQLTPALERVAARYAGEIDLVKVDVDSAPNLSRQYQIQGIPAVKAFRDGRVVADFTGLIPEPDVDRFFASLLPSPADRLVREAADAADPEPLLRDALDLEPAHTAASVALARVLAAKGERDEALQLASRAPADPEAQRLVAELSLAEQQLTQEEIGALRARAATGDTGSDLRLGTALAAAGAHEEALDVLLRAVADPETRDDARAALLRTFAVLGDDHELVRRARPRLASALFA